MPDLNATDGPAETPPPAPEPGPQHSIVDTTGAAPASEAPVLATDGVMPSELPADTMATVRQSDEKLRKCPACGREIPRSTRYCPGCGAYLNPEADRRKRREDDASRWQAVKSSVVFYTVYLSTILPLVWTPEADHATGMLIVSIVDAIIICCYWRMTRTALLPALKPDYNALAYSAAGIALLIPMLALNFGYHRLLLGWFQVKPHGLTRGFELAGYGFWTMVWEICFMPAIWEEIAFRGLIQNKLSQVTRKREAVFLTAVLFAIIHCSPLSGFYLLLLGLLLGVLRLESDSLIPGMVVHFVHNLVVVIAEQKGY